MNHDRVDQQVADADSLAVFNVEKLVNEYGVVYAQQSEFPGPPAWEHNWGDPHPALDRTVPLNYDEPGDLADFIRCPQIWHYACSRAAVDVLEQVCGRDINVYGHGVVGDTQLSFVQVTGEAPRIDRERSVIDSYPTYELVRWPAFHDDDLTVLKERLFTLPGPQFTEVYAGSVVREAIAAAGLTGLRFVRV